jgi:multidrug resistance protein MdtO
LAAVQDLLTCYIEDRGVDHATATKVIRLGMLGTSSLRRALRRSEYSQQYTAEMSSVVAVVGRLVDIAATLTQLSFEPSVHDRKQLRNLAEAIAIFALI